MYIDLLSICIGIFIGCVSSILGVVIYFFNRNRKEKASTNNPFSGDSKDVWYSEETTEYGIPATKTNKSKSKDKTSLSLDYLARTCVEDCLKKYTLEELLQNAGCTTIKEAVVVIADTAQLYIRSYAESVHYDNKSLLQTLNSTSDAELNAIIHSKASLVVSKDKTIQRQILSIINPPQTDSIPEIEPVIDRGGYSNVNKKDMVDVFKETRFYDDRF